jgi:hypothetical protein
MSDTRTALAAIGSIVLLLLILVSVFDGILRTDGGPGLFPWSAI